MTNLAAKDRTLANHPARILVVDNDPLLCRQHAAMLERQGYEVVTSQDGAEALMHLAFDHFDLVLSDRHRPNHDGASMVLSLRNAGSRIPVVMVSGSLTESPLPPAVAREVAATLNKPAALAEVSLAVNSALQHAA